MQRIMLVGETGSGKRQLIRALSGGAHAPRRALSVEYLEPFILTPGEFLENRRCYRALITCSLECRVILFLHNAVKRASLFPPEFASVFNRPVIGVITGTEAPKADICLSQRFLHNTGVFMILPVNFTNPADIEKLRAVIFRTVNKV